MTQVSDTYDDYRQAVSDPRFSDWLRQRAEPAWTDAVDHRFTRELGSGALEEAVFVEYLVQDYGFLEALVSTVGFAVGQAPEIETKRPLVEFLHTLTDEENDYFERAFDALSVPETRWSTVEKTASTSAFADLLGRAAREGGYAETLAVLVPAEWLYWEWASREASKGATGIDLPFYYAEWIDLHANDSFEVFVSWLRDQLDRSGPALSPERAARIDRLFRRTVDLEMAFFDAAYAAAGDDNEVSR